MGGQRGHDVFRYLEENGARKGRCSVSTDRPLPQGRAPRGHTADTNHLTDAPGTWQMRAVSQIGTRTPEVGVAKPEWGTKRICQSCGAKFYDMQRNPIVCPSCGTTHDLEATLRSRRAKPAPAAPAKAAKNVEIEPDDEVDEDADDDDVIEDTSDLSDDDDLADVAIGDDDKE
jgi:uncharacterized protein (TIGR02300 family)